MGTKTFTNTQSVNKVCRSRYSFNNFQFSGKDFNRLKRPHYIPIDSHTNSSKFSGVTIENGGPSDGFRMDGLTENG